MNEDARLFNFLINKEKVEVEKLLKTYKLRKNESFIIIIGVDSDELYESFSDFLYDEVDTLFEYTNLASSNTLNEIAHIETINTDNSMIVNTYNHEESENILNSFQFYRDFISEKKLKIFLFVSKSDFEYLTKHCYDFFSVNSYAFSFTDHSYEIKELNYWIDKYNNYDKSNKELTIQILENIIKKSKSIEDQNNIGKYQEEILKIEKII